jgi:hypothetical protein
MDFHDKVHYAAHAAIVLLIGAAVVFIMFWAIPGSAVWQ